MNKLIFAFFVAAFSGANAQDKDQWRQMCDPSHSNQTIYEFSLQNVHQNDTLDLSDYRGKVVLLVNTATYCGHVMQMVAMKDLQTQYGADGLVVVGVPCNQFHLQEPAWNGVELMNGMEHVRPGNGYVPNFFVSWITDVNGDNEHPLYSYIKPLCPPVNYIITQPLFYSPVHTDDIRWNYEKFLIGRDGKPMYRYSHFVEPATDEQLKADIMAVLAMPEPTEEDDLLG